MESPEFSSGTITMMKPLGVNVLQGCLWGCLFLLGIVGCTVQPLPTSTPTLNVQETSLFHEAILTATYAIPEPTSTPTTVPSFTPTPTQPPVPPELPEVFQTSLLNPMDHPHPYIQDTCQVLKNRWEAGKSAPGTVVMPIMFHSITDGEVNHPYQISAHQVKELFQALEQKGFEAINMEQLAGFLQSNDYIPPRSVVLIVDDLHSASYYRDHFYPYLHPHGWTLTNAWISEPEASRRVRDENIALQREGWVDHQAHGVVHNINIVEFKPGTTIETSLYGKVDVETFIYRELQGSREAILETFGKAPIAYIWPGGNFSARAVQVAREVGYQLGFTVNPRGPLMYNWIPLGDEVDPKRPALLPENYVQDPLMVLPRYWDKDAILYLDTVIRIGEEARAYALENRERELEYYRLVCEPHVDTTSMP